MLSWQPLSAATFTVSNINDAGAGSLRQAIADANAAGAGSHTIDFSLGANSEIALVSALPLIKADMLLIDGSSSSGLTVSGSHATRVFFVESGHLHIKGMHVTNGVAVGGGGGPGGGGGLGAGGGVFVNANAQLTLQNVHFASNAAAGGLGGYYGVGGGGGGGLAGNGGESSFVAEGGGGGGGLYGKGGNSASYNWGGGGGGGQYGNGGESGLYAGGGGGGSTLDGQPSGVMSGGAGGAPEGGNGGDEFQPGADGAIGGGGGGGGEQGNGGAGGDYAGGGGAGLNGRQAGDGGMFGGGGGAKSGGGNGGQGGFGGGGGGGGPSGGSGGNGGFGGGGGAGPTPGSGGFGGAAGLPESHSGGGGGAGFGGAIFAMAGATVTVKDDVTFSDSYVVGGYDGDAISVAGSDGTNLFLMGGTTANFDISADQTLTFDSPIGNNDGTITGVNLIKQGDGKLIVSGSNQYVASTRVDRGTLAVNGTLSGQTTVDSLGTLGGSGTIVGNVTNNGTVAAGNSIGTLTINGNYSQSNSSTMQVEIDPASSDRVNITGTANLDGSVQVLSAPGSYTAMQQYVFLSAAGGVTGAFASITDDLAFLDAQLFYAGNDVGFRLMPLFPDFSNLGQNYNQRQMGAYLDNTASDPRYDDIASNFLLLTHDQAALGLQQLGGEVFATSPQLMLQNTTLAWQNVVGRVRPQASTANYANDLAFARRTSLELVGRSGSSSTLPLQWIDCPTCNAPSRTGWVSGYGLGGVAGSNGSAVGVNYGLGGTQFGLESNLDDCTTAGFFGGYVGTQLNTQTIAQQVTANSGQFGGYFVRDLGRDYYVLAGGFSFDDYESERQLAIGPLASTLSAEYGGWQGITYAERGLTFTAGRAELQPYAALQYIHLRQDALQENGGVGALNVDSLDVDSLRSLAGGRISRPVVTRGGQLLIPQVRASWLHEFLDTHQMANAHFGAFGAGTSFAVQGLDLGRDWALLGGGLTWEITDRLQIAGNYDLQTNDRQTFHIGSGALTYLW